MELNHLKYFYEVAKVGSFTAASRKLRISQSALSKAVALLEESEGVKLLERSKKGVALTPLGSEVFLKSERLFQTFTEIEGACRGQKETPEGSLNFGASDHVTNYLLLNEIQTLKTKHPKVIPSVFSGTPNDLVSLILANEIEFGLFFTKIALSGISYEALFPVPMAVVCHPSLVEGVKITATSARLRAVLQEAGFIGSIKAQYKNHPSQDLMNLLGKSPRVVFESNSQETQKRLCLQGGGVAFLARFMVEEEIKSGALTEIPLSKPLSLNLLLVKKKSRELSLSARTFLKILTESQSQ